MMKVAGEKALIVCEASEWIVIGIPSRRVVRTYGFERNYSV